MAQYLIYFNQQWVGDHTQEWFLSRVRPSMAVIDEMKAAGVYVFAGGLEEGGPVYAADATSGEVTVTDGPFVETTEQLGGFTVVGLNSTRRGPSLTADLRRADVQLVLTEPAHGSLLEDLDDVRVLDVTSAEFGELVRIVRDRLPTQ